MQKFTHILLISLLLLSFKSLGQKQANVWYFGNQAGVDFSSGSPTATTNSALTSLEGSAVISDSSGSLLFYSNGATVWDRNHQVMPNGSGLLGNPSSTQSSIIVPSPALPDREFYLFTTSSGWDGGNPSDGLRYHKIDMCQNSLDGIVLASEKNILLVDSVAEKLAVTQHANGKDYWILTHRFYSDEFWAFLLDENGIVDTVISAIGSVHAGNIAGSQGQMKFANNGGKVAIGATNGLDLLELFDFNTLTGVLSNFQSLNCYDNGRAYGLEFSPNDSLLYCYSGSFSPFGMTISQYNIYAGNTAAINASLVPVYNNPNIFTGRGLQIGIDQKIYSVGLINDATLSVIQNPNALGTACNFQNQSISLGSNTGEYTLPSFIAGFQYNSTTTNCETFSFDSIVACDSFYWSATGQTYTLSDTYFATLTNSQGFDSSLTLILTITNTVQSTDSVTACDAYFWPATGLTYTNSGVYTTTLTNSLGCDSLLTINLTINSLNVGVLQNGNTLSTNSNGTSFQWIDCDANYVAIPGETNPNYSPQSSGNYAVIVTSNECIDTSDCFPYSDLGMPEQDGSNLGVFPNPTNNNVVLDWGTVPVSFNLHLNNALGQELYNQSFKNENKVVIVLPYRAGCYYLHVHLENGQKQILKVIKH